MTEPLSYAQWTPEQHLAQAELLAAEADTKGNPMIHSQAQLQRADVLQIVARADLHLKLRAAKLATEAPAEPQAEAPRAAPKPQRQQGQPKATSS